ncbi:MAG: 5'/3'-nucleotidase SurE [Desulfotignum sp.]|nr:5'/3'-nucleotidase SurE [Desulfotignum sp.]MCF8086500.1 5'/3'-nucleotidase SurE [Desulfotignum sp.]MCF8135902.1 5'/3'-nucleotidase SurE [Desulfotignum sp.]
MKILLTNDDGYQAVGIQSLFKILGQKHQVVMVAPDRERSAVSHSITLHHPVRMYRIESGSRKKIYAVDGTPADCVKLGLAECFKTPPDWVIAGINPGSNIGIDINYSGTVGAAREGALNGISGLAASIKLDRVMDYDNLARYLMNMVEAIGEKGLPSGTFLNINAPGIAFSQIQGIRITRQALNNLSSRFEKRQDPKQRNYYWYGTQEPVSGKPDTDVNAVSQNCLSITPIQCDLTDYKTLAQMPRFSID